MHLWIAVTAHGYGHLAQAAPVAWALFERDLELRITLQGDPDPAFAAGRLPPGFRQIPIASDPALPMHSPLKVRWAEGLAVYEAFEADYERYLKRQLRLFADDPPDVVLADVPWMPLDAARRLGIPAVAMCSLSWYDILIEGPLGAQVSSALRERMIDCYASAEVFLRPAPSMPMAWLPNGRDIGPIARLGFARRDELRGRLGLASDAHVVLVQFGGVAGLDPDDRWPRIDGVHWLAHGDGFGGRHDITAVADLHMPPLDMVASVDLLLTKPGYGSFAEAACHGVPVAYLPRTDWPEEGPLVEWLARQVPTSPLHPDYVRDGKIETIMRRLLDQPRSSPVEPSGVEQAANVLLGLAGSQGRAR